MLPSVGPRGAWGPFSEPGVRLPGPQAPGVSSAVAGRGLGTREVARGPPGRLTLVWTSVQFCQQSVQGPGGGQNREAMQGGTGQRLPRRAASWLRGISLPCPPSPPHSPVTMPPFPEATSPGPVPLPTATGKGMETSAGVGDRAAGGGVEGSRRGRAVGGGGSPLP